MLPKGALRTVVVESTYNVGSLCNIKNADNNGHGMIGNVICVQPSTLLLEEKLSSGKSGEDIQGVKVDHDPKTKPMAIKVRRRWQTT